MGTELFCLSAIVVVLVIVDYNSPYAIHYRSQHPPPPTLEVHSHLTIDAAITILLILGSM